MTPQVLVNGAPPSKANVTFSLFFSRCFCAPPVVFGVIDWLGIITRKFPSSPSKNVRSISKSLSADFRKANWVLLLPRHIHTDGCGKSGFATGAATGVGVS